MRTHARHSARLRQCGLEATLTDRPQLVPHVPDRAPLPIQDLLDAGRCLTKFEPPGTSEISWLTLERDLAHLRDRRTRGSSMTATEWPDGLTSARLRRRTARHATARSAPGRARALLSRPHES